MKRAYRFSPVYDPESDFSFHLGDCLDFLGTIPMVQPGWS